MISQEQRSQDSYRRFSERTFTNFCHYMKSDIDSISSNITCPVKVYMNFHSGAIINDRNSTMYLHLLTLLDQLSIFRAYYNHEECSIQQWDYQRSHVSNKTNKTHSNRTIYIHYFRNSLYPRKICICITYHYGKQTPWIYIVALKNNLQ